MNLEDALNVVPQRRPKTDLLAEDIITTVLSAKCTQPSALNVEKKQQYLSNPPVISLCIVATASILLLATTGKGPYKKPHWPQLW